MPSANLDLIVTLINEQMTRLGLDDNTFGTNAPAVNIDDDAPEGFVRISEDGYQYVGPAAAMLEVLEAIKYNGELDDADDHVGLQAMFAAFDADSRIIDNEYGPEELGPTVWNDHHEFAGMDLPGDLGLIVVRTNGGLRYGFAPDSNEFAAFNSTHDFSPWYGTIAEAVEEAGAWATQQEVK